MTKHSVKKTKTKKHKLNLRKTPTIPDSPPASIRPCTLVDEPAGSSPPDKVSSGLPVGEPWYGAILRKSSKKPEIIKPSSLVERKKSQATKTRRAKAKPAVEPRAGIPQKEIWRYFQGERLFAIFALVALVVTTLFWATLGARANMNNSDQLADSYMFESWHTFQKSHFPATHTFLLKWPIFIATSAFGNTDTSIQIATIAVVTLTVLAMAYLAWRIIRRPVAWAMLVLTLALATLLIPIQASPTTLLPVNMAMLTTRNLEYIVYILCLAMIVKTVRLRSWCFVLATMLFGLLFASDRLFLPLSICASLAFVSFGFIWRRVELRRTGFLCAASCVLALALALAIAHGLGQFTGISYIETASPYAIASLRDIVLGIVYSLLGILTNLGVNPAPSVLTLRDWPSEAIASFRGVAGIAHLAMVCAGLYIIITACRRLWRRRRSIEKRPFNSAEQLSLLLLASSVAAVASFVFTNHYYAGDARYLTITFFTIFIITATLLRGVKLRARWVRDWTALVAAALVAGVYVAYAGYSDVVAAQNQYAMRNKAILQILTQHPAGYVVGDYWRVLPLRNLSSGSQRVTPLQGCTEPRSVLSSDAWVPTEGESFAYLLTLDKGQTDFPPCTLEQVVSRFGRPNGSVVVAGTSQQPLEMLLFYDQSSLNGGKDSKVNVSSFRSANLTDLPKGSCSAGTVLQVVAHPDDDLLFMNPDLSSAIEAGLCVRTLYLTAGDNGGGAYYWLGRQLGVETAYTTIMGVRNGWQSQSVRLESGQLITASSPRADDRITLLFLNLPDGGPSGHGFPATHYASLQRLLAGDVKVARSVDEQSAFTREDLIATLRQLTDHFKPNEIRTFAPSPFIDFADHSDHTATGFLTTEFIQFYQPKWTEKLSLNTYLGYPINALPPSLSEEDTHKKESAFLQYATHDNGVCQSLEDCYNSTAYGGYLQRQYTLQQYESSLAPSE
ncbi:PIG-L family deacetylase [Candidatus Saccharibacteria bacterium]|nr:PIG-L family deacetylase [Candidatus Saccharibacteria bacterium]